MYICIYTVRNYDIILFHHQGGVDVGDVDVKVSDKFLKQYLHKGSGQQIRYRRYMKFI